MKAEKGVSFAEARKLTLAGSAPLGGGASSFAEKVKQNVSKDGPQVAPQVLPPDFLPIVKSLTDQIAKLIEKVEVLERKLSSRSACVCVVQSTSPEVIGSDNTQEVVSKTSNPNARTAASNAVPSTPQSIQCSLSSAEESDSLPVLKTVKKSSDEKLAGRRRVPPLPPKPKYKPGPKFSKVASRKKGTSDGAVAVVESPVVLSDRFAALRGEDALSEEEIMDE